MRVGSLRIIRLGGEFSRPSIIQSNALIEICQTKNKLNYLYNFWKFSDQMILGIRGINNSLALPILTRPERL